MTNFQKDVSENIINYANTSFIENISNIKDVIRSPPNSPVGSVQSDLCSIDSNDEIIHSSNEPILRNINNAENIVISTSNPDKTSELAHNFGLDGIITIDVSSDLHE
jgi:hypothetical protein